MKHTLDVNTKFPNDFPLILGIKKDQNWSSRFFDNIIWLELWWQSSQSIVFKVVEEAVKFIIKFDQSKWFFEKNKNFFFDKFQQNFQQKLIFIYKHWKKSGQVGFEDWGGEMAARISKEMQN